MDANRCFGRRFVWGLAVLCFVVAPLCMGGVEGGIISGVLNRLCAPEDDNWQAGTATYYAGGHGGACGFAGLGYSIFAENYCAVSTAIWDGGAACGTCLEVRCKAPESACIPGATIKVTVTDFCPNIHPNLQHCGTDKRHLDLGQNIFPKIAAKSAGVLDIEWRRVPCVHGPSFTVSVDGNRFGYLALNVMAIPGAGSITSFEVKGANGNYETCHRDWGNVFIRTGKTIETPVSLKITVAGACTFEAKDCIKSLNFGSSVSCTYSPA